MTDRYDRMPLTFPAHQAVVLPVKLRWPHRVDGTAMCVGAAVPDLTYPFMFNQGQTLLGGLIVGLPLTMLICAVLRWRASSGVFANLPDMGPWRIHSYRVISERQPAIMMTVVSAALGVTSHVVLDSITHNERLLARLMHLDTVLFTLPRIDDIDIALLLQLIGHVLGSVVAIWLFWLIGVRRHLEDWYGPAQVRAARRFTLTAGQRLVFWAVTIASTGASYVVFAGVDGRLVFKLMLGATIGALAAGCLVGRDLANGRQ